MGAASDSYDLGTLAVSRSEEGQVVLSAPSPVTRASWIVGALGCLVYLWSMVVALELFDTSGGLNLPQAGEVIFWLVPLLLCAFCVRLALGGIRLTLDEAGLRIENFWPNRSLHAYPWADLRYARFWEEPSRSREALYAMRFTFAEGEITLRIPDEALWRRLRRRFSP